MEARGQKKIRICLRQKGKLKGNMSRVEYKLRRKRGGKIKNRWKEICRKGRIDKTTPSFAKRRKCGGGKSGTSPLPVTL